MKKTLFIFLMLVGSIQVGSADEGPVDCLFEETPFWTMDFILPQANDKSIPLTGPFPFHRIGASGELSQTALGRQIIDNHKYNRKSIAVKRLSADDFQRLMTHLQNVGCDVDILESLKSNRQPLTSQ